MPASPHVTVRIDLDRIRTAAEQVRGQTNVDVIAVIKADAYGLGAARVADAIAGVVDGFYLFELSESRAANVKRFDKDVIVLNDESSDPTVYRDAGARPVVWTVERAKALVSARPILSVDTGQQRFAAAARDVEAILMTDTIAEAMTHASRPDQAMSFDKLTANHGLCRHAAGTSLLDEPAARFDAVRPGLALYRDAAHVSARLVDARNAIGPAGYSGFVTRRHGVILAGYAHGLRRGPCLVNGQRRHVLEVGMQTSFIELGDGDRIGDEVVLLGDALSVDDVAAFWQASPQEVLVRLCGAGELVYAGSGRTSRSHTSS